MVYIDNMNRPYGDMIMCHMIADSSAELLAMAEKIGVKSKWIQYPGTKREHFDICLTKKKKAIAAGAQEITVLELGYMIQGIDEDEPGPASKAPKEMDLAEFAQWAKDNPDWKGKDSTGTEQITVKIGELKYCIPHCCLAGALWGMPDEFYPCDKYEWADHPYYFTTVEMVKAAIAAKPDNFKAYILF